MPLYIIDWVSNFVALTGVFRMSKNVFYISSLSRDKGLDLTAELNSI